MLPSVQVDEGAIRSILNGADVMAPGLTSLHSRLPADLKPDSVVVRKAAIKGSDSLHVRLHLVRVRKRQGASLCHRDFDHVRGGNVSFGLASGSCLSSALD
jgi:hypothetical protein